MHATLTPAHGTPLPAVPTVPGPPGAEGAFTSHLTKLRSGFLETLRQARVLLLSNLKRETYRVEQIHFLEIQNKKKKNECA